MAGTAGMAGMAWGHERYRLALTVFAEPGDLWRTVTSLLASGVSVEQMCLVALAALLPRFASPAVRPESHLDDMSKLLGQVQAWPGASEAPQIVATKGALSQAVLGARALNAAAGPPGCWRLDPRTDFESFVREGQVALIVRSSTTAEQLRVTRALLENTKQRVLTIEPCAPVQRQLAEPAD